MGIPMRIIRIDGLAARCEAKGVERDASLLLLEHEALRVGDYVVVHLGHAIERISAERAAEAWALYDEMLAADTGGAEPPR
jgi:hydrogenase expression/formation protein HypC